MSENIKQKVRRVQVINRFCLYLYEPLSILATKATEIILNHGLNFDDRQLVRC